VAAIAAHGSLACDFSPCAGRKDRGDVASATFSLLIADFETTVRTLADSKLGVDLYRGSAS
ncbi:hypothetical protein BHE74_00003461, partial [Ensete ventricosum]